MKKRVQKMVLEYSPDDAEGEAEARFITCPLIQALVAMSDPVGHSAKGGREEAKATKWNYANAYYFYAAKFEGNCVTKSTPEMAEVVKKDPRWFDEKVQDSVHVSNKVGLVFIVSLSPFNKLK
jgi:hypothetical protein